jgi:hypothetical protein
MFFSFRLSHGMAALSAEPVIRPQDMPALRAKLSLGAVLTRLPEFGNPALDGRFDIFFIGLERPQDISSQDH